MSTFCNNLKEKTQDFDLSNGEELNHSRAGEIIKHERKSAAALQITENSNIKGGKRSIPTPTKSNIKEIAGERQLEIHSKEGIGRKNGLGIKSMNGSLDFTSGLRAPSNKIKKSSKTTITLSSCTYVFVVGGMIVSGTYIGLSKFSSDGNKPSARIKYEFPSIKGKEKPTDCYFGDIETIYLQPPLPFDEFIEPNAKDIPRRLPLKLLLEHTVLAKIAEKGRQYHAFAFALGIPEFEYMEEDVDEMDYFCMSDMTCLKDVPTVTLGIRKKLTSMFTWCQRAYPERKDEIQENFDAIKGDIESLVRSWTESEKGLLDAILIANRATHSRTKDILKKIESCIDLNQPNSSLEDWKGILNIEKNMYTYVIPAKSGMPETHTKIEFHHDFLPFVKKSMIETFVQALSELFHDAAIKSPASLDSEIEEDEFINCTSEFNKETYPPPENDPSNRRKYGLTEYSNSNPKTDAAWKKMLQASVDLYDFPVMGKVRLTV